VPTGFRIDPEQVRLDGRAVALRATAAGEPLVRLTARSRGLLTYGVRPAADPQWMPRPAATTPALLAEAADEIGLRPAPERLEAATDWVRAHIAYSASDATVEQHRRARAAGHDALAAALEVGAADCDVQNAVLTTLLQAVDVPARLAIGYVGADGAALTPPHAWVEVRAGTGWKVVDASEGGAPAGRGPTRARVTVPQSGAAQAAGRAGESEVRAAGIDAAPPRPAFAADRRALVWGASGLAALTAALAGLMLTRTRRVLRVGPRSDIAALLRGALERPEAFRHVPALYRRPLVPRIDGPLLSLEAVARLSNDRRLFRSTTRSPLARRAAASGAVVVDAASREGRTAADALGAVDLDEWDLFLRGARRTPLLDAVEKRMGRLGERWQLRAAPGIGAPAVLDLATTQGPARIVVLDGQAPWLLAAEARSPRRRAEATFVIVDRLADAVRLPPDDRRRLLAPLALEALREAAGTGDPRA
jgi:transglutaminase-like putative cysteine protease